MVAKLRWMGVEVLTPSQVVINQRAALSSSPASPRSGREAVPSLAWQRRHGHRGGGNREGGRRGGRDNIASDKGGSGDDAEVPVKGISRAERTRLRDMEGGSRNLRRKRIAACQATTD